MKSIRPTQPTASKEQVTLNLKVNFQRKPATERTLQAMKDFAEYYGYKLTAYFVGLDRREIHIEKLEELNNGNGA